MNQISNNLSSIPLKRLPGKPGTKKESSQPGIPGDKVELGKSGVGQSNRMLKQRMATIKKEAKKGYLLGLAGMAMLTMTLATPPLVGVGLMAAGTMALYKGCQTMVDKVELG
ncbi:MAG: hypothetical protein ACLFQV_03865 [Vulcanimicrobiota bacterium]